MRPTSKTLFLAFVALLLLGLNLLDRGTGERIVEQLPAIAAVPRESVSRIELSSAIEKIVLQRVIGEGIKGALDGEGRWKLSAPIEGDADQVAVRSLLNNFRKAAPVDVRVDQKNLEEYGLDAGNGIVVELFEQGDQPVVSFTIGNDGPGGSSFVRISGDDAIYRARLGGRFRYARTAAEWRNHVLMDFEPNGATGLTVAIAGQTPVVLVRSPETGVDGKETPGTWAMEPDPGWALDQAALNAIVDTLGRMRAGDMLAADFDGGFASPRGSIEVALADGTTRQLVVGAREIEGAAFVRVGTGGSVYRVSKAQMDKLLRGRDDLRDRTLLAFARKDVDTVTLVEGGEAVILQQDLSNNLWGVLQPPNIDLDIRLIFFTVNTLAGLKGLEVAPVTPAQAGLEPPAWRIDLRFLDGRTTGVEFGERTRDERGQERIFVRTQGSPTVFTLGLDTAKKLREGFGKSE